MNRKFMQGGRRMWSGLSDAWLCWGVCYCPDSLLKQAWLQPHCPPPPGQALSAPAAEEEDQPHLGAGPGPVCANCPGERGQLAEPPCPAVSRPLKGSDSGGHFRLVPKRAGSVLALWSFLGVW